MRYLTEEIQLASHLTNEQRQLTWRLRNKGWSLRAIAKEVGCSYPDIRASLLGRPRAVRPDLWVPATGHLGQLRIALLNSVPSEVPLEHSLAAATGRSNSEPVTLLHPSAISRTLQRAEQDWSNGVTLP